MGILHARIEDRRACVAVVGMGYVGLPLAHAVHEAGFHVVGIDHDSDRVRALQAGESYLGTASDPIFKLFASSDRFSASMSEEGIGQCDVVLMCVPTPLGENREPDLSYVKSAARMIADSMRAGTLVSLESTTWPGTTRKVVQPILEESGRIVGEDCFLAYSPERENPGDATWQAASIPKLVGGVNDQSRDLAAAFYAAVVEHVVVVSSTEVAEAAKITENVYRCVNIALVNELKLAYEQMGIDIWEVIEASATKPFGFEPFWPGPGLGGHCIPVDPFYLAWRARQSGGATRFIELAGEINTAMPEVVAKRVVTELELEGANPEGASVLLIGVAYKPNVSDMRETPAAPIFSGLKQCGCDVFYHDPHCSTFSLGDDLHTSVPLDIERVHNSDVVVIITDHDEVDWQMIAREADLIIDCRNVMQGLDVAGRLVKA